MPSPSYESMNTMQKLAKARLYFLNSKVGKSGKNILLEFKYFELEDIVPIAIRIFDRVGLVAVDDFGGEVASKTIYNIHDPNDTPVIFQVKYREAEQIINKNGKAVTNPLQALGSSITYLRRYLWMVALDITEPDNVDENIGAEEAAPEPVKAAPKPPATPQERAEIKKELTHADNTGNASPEQLEELKSLCKTLRNLDEEKQDEFVQKIAMQTKGFTEIPVDACEKLCEHLNAIIAEYGDVE